MLRVARAIGRARPVRVVTSFLGAHAVPAELKGRADEYIDSVCHSDALETAHAEGLVDAVDGFCEGIAFDIAQIRRVFDKASAGLAGQAACRTAQQYWRHQTGGSEYGALSADHVEYADEDDAKALAASGSVAVLLPGAFYTLHETQMPPTTGFP